MNTLELDPVYSVGSAFDDFDGDLLKLVPEVADIPDFKATRDITLWTYGSVDVTKTKLAHPATWNTFGAFFWKARPTYPRDRFGWISIDGHVTSAPILSLTAYDAIRDAWVHHYSATLDGKVWILANHDRMMRLLYRSRNWTGIMPDEREAEMLKFQVMDWVIDSARKVMLP